MARVDVPVRTTGVKKAESQFKQLGASLSGMAMGLGGLFAGTKILGFFKDTVAASAEQEKIFRGLRTTIELSGKSYQSLEKDLMGYFAQLQKTTEYGDTDSAKVLTTLVQLTGNYDKALAALPLTLDIASLGIFDMNTAARNVAMTLEGNIELMARYLPQLKASVTPFLKTASAAEKAEFAVNLLNEKFGGTAVENVKTYAGQVNILANDYSDLQEKFGDLTTKAAVQTGVIKGLSEYVKLLIEDWSNLSPSFLASTILLKEFNKELKKNNEEWEVSINIHKKIAEGIGEAREGYAEWMEGYRKFAKEREKAQETEALELEYWKAYTAYIGLIATETMPMLTGEVSKLTTEFEDQLQPMKKVATEIDKFAPQLGELSANVQKAGNQLTSTFDYIFTESLVRGQNFFDAFLAGFVGMLEQMAAAMLARAAVFGIFSALGFGGILSGGKGALSFITGFQHGGSFTVGGQGGPDSQMVAFKASPGERVSVTPESHTTNDNSIVINVHGSIDPIVYKRDLKPLLNKISRGIAV